MRSDSVPVSLKYKCKRARAAFSRAPVVLVAPLVSHGIATTAADTAEFKLSKTIPAGSGDETRFSQVTGMFVDAEVRSV